MKKAIIALVVVALVLPVTLWGAVSLWRTELVNQLIKPHHRRFEDPITVPPDYATDRYWASLPSAQGSANLVPSGQEARSGHANAAVFYIHPTSYISGDRWNSPLFENSWAWEMVDRMMASQASAFNACCDVYAPHYREATLWSFIERETKDGLHALDIAYMDVAKAFTEFLSRYAHDRPFIIASHSQGTAHALRLLSQKVNNNPELRNRLVGAYLVGYYLPLDMFERELTNIPPCESTTDTGCVVHWATFGEEGQPQASVPHWYTDGWEYSDGKEFLCTNPLSWRRDEDLIPASAHPGALQIPADFGLKNLLFNQPTGERISAIPDVLPQWTWAQCRDGMLYVEPQLTGPFANERDGDDRNYHTRDYALFYQAVRENAVLRSARVNYQSSLD